MKKFLSYGLVGVHFFAGILVSGNPGLSYFWGILVLVLGLGDILINGNRNNRAGVWAGYFLGMEVLLRMTNGMIFWEMGKYGVALLLLAGMLAERTRRETPWPYVFYFLLLLPSILVADYPDAGEAREQISFNLSGPFCLAVSVFYFFKRNLNPGQLVQQLFVIMLPLISMVTYIILVSPDLDTITFSTQSNFAASGGYGPNQVSTALGLGVLLTGIAIFFKAPLSKLLIVDVFFFTVFSFRGLVTFSRGGVVSAILALSIMVVAFSFSSRSKNLWLSYLFTFIVILSGIAYVIIDYSNEATKSMLTYRYTGTSAVTGQQEDLTSHRLDILEHEIEWFKEQPVTGIGPGMGKYYLKSTLGIGASSHSELTRLMGEHGIMGLISLVILVVTPIRHLKNLKSPVKAILVAFLVLSLLTMAHSAMRLAIPSFLYGLVFIYPFSKTPARRTLSDQ